MTTEKKFLESTNIDPNYFLCLVLNMLGVLEDEEDLGSCSYSEILCLDRTGKVTGVIRITEKSMLIERSE